MLMTGLAPGMGAVRAACEEVFALRGTHEWPPVLDPPMMWEDSFVTLAADVELPVQSLSDAVRKAQAFIDAVADAS